MCQLLQLPVPRSSSSDASAAVADGAPVYYGDTVGLKTLEGGSLRFLANTDDGKELLFRRTATARSEQWFIQPAFADSRDKVCVAIYTIFSYICVCCSSVHHSTVLILVHAAAQQGTLL
jgi:hypothetical protein